MVQNAEGSQGDHRRPSIGSVQWHGAYIFHHSRSLAGYQNRMELGGLAREKNRGHGGRECAVSGSIHRLRFRSPAAPSLPRWTWANLESSGRPPAEMRDPCTPSFSGTTALAPRRRLKRLGCVMRHSNDYFCQWRKLQECAPLGRDIRSETRPRSPMRHIIVLLQVLNNLPHGRPVQKGMKLVMGSTDASIGTYYDEGIGRSRIYTPDGSRKSRMCRQQSHNRTHSHGKPESRHLL
jgi:hypothetical protein